jgi:hypothetical protein
MKKINLFFLFIFVAFAAFSQGGIRGTRNGMPAPNTTPSSPLALSQDIVILQENMDNVANLASAGWIFNDVDGAGTTTFFQGNDAVFGAYNGASNSYFGQNYNGAFGGGFLIDQWLITPEITSYNETTFSFWTRAAGAPYYDHIYIYYSPTGSSNLADFVLLRNRTVVPSAWTQFSETVTANGPVRFAIRYYETDGGTNGDDSNYFGIDAVQVVGNPVAAPISIWWIVAAFVVISGFTVYRFRLRRA